MSENLKNILEWVYCIIIALVLALLFRYFIATPTTVKQRSMYPTLQDGQRLILNRTSRITKKTPNDKISTDISTVAAIINAFDAFSIYLLHKFLSITV